MFGNSFEQKVMMSNLLKICNFVSILTKTSNTNKPKKSFLEELKHFALCGLVFCKTIKNLFV